MARPLGSNFGMPRAENEFDVDGSTTVVFGALVQVVPVLGMVVDSADAQGLELKAKTPMSLMSYGQVVTMTVLPLSETESRVSVVSKGRMRRPTLAGALGLGNKGNDENVVKIENAVRSFLAKNARPAAAASPAAPASPASADLAGRLQQLASLRDSGLLTESEYEAKRAELLKTL